MKLSRYIGAIIRDEWIEQVVNNPVKETVQKDGRIRRWALISLGDSNHDNQIFSGHDTLHIEFRAAEVSETKDSDEDTQLDIDKDGNICAMTTEHARERADIPHFSFEQIAA